LSSIKSLFIPVRPISPNAADKEAAEGDQLIWRAIRAQRPGWTMHDLAQVTRLSDTHAVKYCYWLYPAGYIARNGQRDSATLWRATKKAKEQ
jgi:predicted MarR family transcription regulator